MTMNLKKVFTSTSFNLSSVFYARFCAGSFYQEFDECRTFLLYKKKKPLTRYLLTHQQLLSCFVSVYYSVLFRLFTIFNTVVIIHIHAEFYRGIWFSVAQEAHSFYMKGLLSMNYHRERKHIHEPFNDRSRLSLKSVTTENTFLTVLYF